MILVWPSDNESMSSYLRITDECLKCNAENATIISTYPLNILPLVLKGGAELFIPYFSTYLLQITMLFGMYRTFFIQWQTEHT